MATLCPLYLTAHINDVYYYYCQNCSDHTYVGAQDIKKHVTGPCPNCSEPLVVLPHSGTSKIQPTKAYTATAATASDLPVQNSIPWLPTGIYFDNSRFHVDHPTEVTLHNYTENQIKASFQLNGATKSVRLFTIEFTWPRGSTGSSKWMRIGQELEDPADTPTGVGATTPTAVVDSMDTSGKFLSIKVTILGIEYLYYVLMK